MGNEQSGGGGALSAFGSSSGNQHKRHSSSASTSNLHAIVGGTNSLGGGLAASASSAAATATSSSSALASGVTASFSFLSRKRDSTKSLTPIITVNNRSTSPSASLTDPREADELKRLKEIPRFMPLLKGALPTSRTSLHHLHQQQHPHMVDAVVAKIEPKHIQRFLQRLHYHFALCAQTVCKEQEAAYAGIPEMDQLVKETVKELTRNGKKYELAVEELSKSSRHMREQLDSVHVLLLEVVDGLESLNLALPDSQRLPPIASAYANSNNNISSLVKSLSTETSGKIQPAAETKVVDK